MINLNASLWDRIALLADIPKSFPLYKYIKIENKMFAEARSLEESPVKNMKDLNSFTTLRVTLGEVYKYLSDNELTTGLNLITVKEEDIKAKGLFTFIKDFYKKSKNSNSLEVDKIEKFIYLFTSERSGTDISNNQSQEMDEGYLNLREKIKGIQENIAMRYRSSGGSSLFNLIKNTDLFGLDLDKYLGTEDEIYVYKFLYLLFSLFELEHNNTNFCLLIEKLEEMHPKLSLINFRNNLHDYQDILFSNKEALEYLICNLGGEPEDISRTLCFYYAMEQYSIKTDITDDSRKKRKGGILLFNILRNPGLEVMPAYVINKKEIINTNKLPAFYTKYGYYFDNIIKECAKYETLNTKDPDNTYQNKARILNCALQFLIKKAFLSLTAQPNSSEEVLAGKINEVNMELEDLLEKIAVSKDQPHDKLFDAIVFRLEGAIQIGKSNALQAAQKVIEEWLKDSEAHFVSAPDLSTVEIDEISTYLKSDICEIFSKYNYSETDCSKLRAGADFIQKAATAYCENSLYENYNYKRNKVSLCEIDAICYAYLNGYFKKKVRCHGYTLDGTSEERELKTVIENQNLSRNSNNLIYYFNFFNTLINHIVAKRGLYEQVYIAVSEYEAFILKLEAAILKKYDEKTIRRFLGKILTISLPFFDTNYDKNIANLLLKTINEKLINNMFNSIYLTFQENRKSEIISILSQEILFFYYSYFDKIILTETELKKAVNKYCFSNSGIFFEYNYAVLTSGYDAFKKPFKEIVKRTIFDVPVRICIIPKTASQGILLEIGF